MTKDEQLAIGVMGWHKREAKESFYEVYSDPNDPEFVMYVHDWHPSEDIRQSFMVVEKMRERGYQLQRLRQLYKTGIWTCEFAGMKGLSNSKEFGDTPAQAVVDAAMAAMDGEK